MNNEAERREFIDGHKGSNKTLKDYCAEKGIPVHKFYYWKKQLYSNTSQQADKKFIELKATDNPLSSHLEIALGGAIKIRLPQHFSDTALTSILDTLKQQELI